MPFTLHINHPSKLARYSSHGMAPVLVLLRPSNEHILIVRVPGARDQHGCHSVPPACTDLQAGSRLAVRKAEAQVEVET